MRKLNYYLVFTENNIYITKHIYAGTVGGLVWKKIEVICDYQKPYVYTMYGKYDIKELLAPPLIKRMVIEREGRMGWESKHLAYKDPV